MDRVTRRMLGRLGYEVHRPLDETAVVGPSPVVFDVGGNRGQSIRRYRALFPDAVIHSFEPFPAAFDELQTVADQQNATAHRLALAEANGTRTLHVSPVRDATNSLLPRARSRRYYPSDGELTENVDVEVRRLTSVCPDLGIEYIDLLKLDVQGAEMRVLEGGEALLQAQRIGAITAEVFFVAHYEGAALYFELAAYLARFGYTIFQVSNLVTGRNGQLRFGNAIFVGPQVRRRLDAAPPEP